MCLALLRHGYLLYCVASDAKLLETSHGLGTGVPRARDALRQRDLRGGELKKSDMPRGFHRTKT